MRTVQATSKAVIELGDYLRARQIQVVTLESASDYWRIWFVLLEAAGLRVQLVSARAVKNAPGRAKTGKKDAVWLAKLTEKGLRQPSFVPPYEIRRLRELTRLRTDLVHDKSRYRARLEKLLERALIKISAVRSTLDTDTARAGKAGKGNPWLNGILGEIAASASRTDTFPGERYRRIARRRGKRKAMAAIARSILVIIFHLLSDRSARFRDLGPDFYDTQINRDRKIRNHVRQLQALGISPEDLAALVTKNPPAA